MEPRMAHASRAAGGRHRQRRSATRWPRRCCCSPPSGVIAAAYVAYVLWPRWPDAPVALDAPSLPIIVAGVMFNIEPAAIRMTVQRQPGTQERVDLAYLWPSLMPPDPAEQADASARRSIPTSGCSSPSRPASARCR